jgi:hypothetical protein
MPKFGHGKLCERCLDGYYKYLAKTCGNYMVCNMGAMDNLNRKCANHNFFDVPVLDVFNVCYFLLCYDIVHKSIMHTCFSGIC